MFYRKDYHLKPKLQAKHPAAPGIPPGIRPFLPQTGKTSGGAWHSPWNMAIFTPNSGQIIRRRLAIPPGIWPFLPQTPGKTSGGAWHSAWNSAIFTPNSGQIIRRRLAFRLEYGHFYPKLRAKHPAVPEVLPDIFQSAVFTLLSITMHHPESYR